MDITKFISLLDSRQLFFTRADKFEDPFEGTLPKFAYDSFLKPLTIEPEKARVEWTNERDRIRRKITNMRRFHAVNCWHVNEHESDAMWKLYLKSNEGIAIQSTYDRLRKSINDLRPIYFGMVNYINYETDECNILGDFEILMHKRKSFEHERELRAIYADLPPNHESNDVDWETDRIHGGTPIFTDPNKLIENVYIAPNAPQWFKTLISSIIEKYEFSFPVQQSNLLSAPLL